MRRFHRTASVAVACLGALAAAGTASAASAPQATPTAGTTAARVCSISLPIQIRSLAFQPPAVAPGQSAQAVLSAWNCTAVPQNAYAQWTGRFVGAEPGIPAGCPAIDPLLVPMRFPARGLLTTSIGYSVPASCTASELVVGVQIRVGGVVVAQDSATLDIVSVSS